jgi:hypothetical protein
MKCTLLRVQVLTEVAAKFLGGIMPSLHAM